MDLDRRPASTDYEQLLFETERLHQLGRFEKELEILLARDLEDDEVHQAVEILRRRARAEGRLHRPLKALRWIDQALERSPDFGSRAVLLGARVMPLRDLGRSDEALETVDKAIELSVEDSESTAQLWHVRAVLHTERGEVDEAHAAIQRAFMLTDDKSPIGLIARITRCAIDIQCGAFEDALAAARSGLADCVAAGHPGLGDWAQSYIGSIQWHIGRLDEAAEAFEGLNETDLRLRPFSSVYHAMVAAELGVWDQAKQLIRRGREDACGNPLATALVAFGAALLAFLSGDEATARARLQEGRAMHPRGVYYPLAMHRALQQLLDGRPIEVEGEVFHADERSFIAWAKYLAGGPLPGPEDTAGDKPRGGWARILVALHPTEIVLPDTPTLRMLDSRVELPDGTQIDLARRRTLRDVLLRLIAAHGEGEEGVGVHALFEAAWKGDRCDPESAAARVYVAVRRLRDLGLRAWIETTEDGYRLSRSLRIQPSSSRTT